MLTGTVCTFCLWNYHVQSPSENPFLYLLQHTMAHHVLDRNAFTIYLFPFCPSLTRKNILLSPYIQNIHLSLLTDSPAGSFSTLPSLLYPAFPR